MKNLLAKTFIVAEIGTNHLCNPDLAIYQVRTAICAGADAIKFQIFNSEKLASDKAKPYWLDSNCDELQPNYSQLDYYKTRDKFGYSEYKELFDLIKECDRLPFASVFDDESLQLAVDLKSELIKIASCEITNYRLLEAVGSAGIPVILSTGGATAAEISTAVSIISRGGADIFALLCCTLQYPAELRYANLARIPLMRSLYPFVVGYSDHTIATENMLVPALAVALGAKVIERHYDCRVTGAGSDGLNVGYKYFRKMVDNIRMTEAVLGDGNIQPMQGEFEALTGARRSIIADTNIDKGTVIRLGMLAVKRPMLGIPCEYLDMVIGASAARDIKKGEFIHWEDLIMTPSLDNTKGTTNAS